MIAQESFASKGWTPFDFQREVWDAYLAGESGLVHAAMGQERRSPLPRHLHPSVLLVGAGRQSARLPCFWFGARVGVLPAFGDFTGFSDAPVSNGDQIWVIVEGAVLRVSEQSVLETQRA